MSHYSYYNQVTLYSFIIKRRYNRRIIIYNINFHFAYLEGLFGSLESIHLDEALFVKIAIMMRGKELHAVS